MNGNANLNANNLTPQNVEDWRKKLGIFDNKFTFKRLSLTVESTRQTTVDLSTYIDNYDPNGIYEILVSCVLWGSKANYFQVATDVVPDFENVASTTTNKVDRSYNEIILQAKRYFYYKLYTTSDATNYSTIYAYKRVG